MHSTFNRSSATILTVSIVLALLFVLNYSVAQWTDAPANPPNNNVAAPINVGPQDQQKYVDPANKTVGSNGIIGANEFVGFDRMRANQYCDLNGNNCSSAAGGGGGGGSIIAHLRNSGKSFSAAPNGISEWPDYVYCGGRVMPFAKFNGGGGPSYGAWPIGDNYVGKVDFNAGGQQSSNNVGSCGDTHIVNICQLGNCGFYTGGAPAVQSGLTCNQYGCSEFGSCSAGGCPSSEGEVCNAYGCS